MYPEGQHILVIDDDAARRQLSERVLAAEGFAVTAVAEGFSALRAAGRQRFAVAVVAARLPGSIDGPAALRHLRARQPWLRALFVGGPAAGSRSAECEDIVPAAFRPRDLLGCVFELLQRGRVQRGSGGDRSAG